ncbi:hypothetical protein EVG20_g10324 [Dentipellis fragilis]|uniref:Uncharacterized protein n=1 Tax=Dentipellis fragilis TaxID=205917 RepID=A0A4Y9XWL1_9AGAM|nr:hypothetical protein EVG20_g10324 [Dentipellis fragilis]
MASFGHSRFPSSQTRAATVPLLVTSELSSERKPLDTDDPRPDVVSRRIPSQRPPQLDFSSVALTPSPFVRPSPDPFREPSFLEPLEDTDSAHTLSHSEGDHSYFSPSTPLEKSSPFKFPLPSLHGRSPSFGSLTLRSPSFRPPSFTVSQDTRLRLRVFLGWPLAIFVGQLLLLGLAWGFTGAVFFAGPFPVADGLAERISNNPRATALCVTLIATALSLFSTFLFSRAIRYALMYRLSRSLSLFSLYAGIRLSHGAMVFDRRHRGWTVITLFSTVALAAQIAGWTALLTPTDITIRRTIRGTELDLGSDAFQRYLASIGSVGELTSALMGANGEKNVSPMSVPATLIDGAAIAEAGRQFGYPAMVTFNGALFNVSTGGILPTGSSIYKGPNSGNNQTFNNFAGLPLPGRYQFEGHGRVPHPSGFLTRYTMDQQGFTVDVSCQQIPDTALPSLTSSGASALNGLRPSGVGQSEWTTTCPDGKIASQTVTTFSGSNHPPGSAVLSNPCFFQNMSSTPTSGADPSTHLLVLVGQGQPYSFIDRTVCSIQPVLTGVQVDYGPAINVSRISTSRVLQEPSDGDSNAAALGTLVVSVLNQRINGTQTLAQNMVGDNLAAVFQSIRVGGGGDADHKIFNEILEAYVKGIAEFLGTVVRTGLSSQGVWPDDQIPDDMSISTAGELWATTIGFNYESGVGTINLLPTSFITIISIGLTLYSFSQRPGTWDDETNATGIGGGIGMRRDGNPSSSQFDPTNPLHLIVVASAGGMTALGDFRDPVAMAQYERMRVRLGLVNSNEWTGFIPEDC